MSFHGGSPLFRGLLLGLLGTSISGLAADPGATQPKSFAKPKVNPSTLIAAAPDASAAADPTTPAPNTPPATPATDPTTPPPIVPNPANPALPDGTNVP